jgi:hypothetical protein
LQFQHETAKKQYGPSPYIAPTYGAKQQMTSIDDSPLLSKDDKKLLQQVCGKFLYYARTIDDTMMYSLNALATRVSNGTDKTKSAMKHFLDYCHTNPDAITPYQDGKLINGSILMIAKIIKMLSHRHPKLKLRHYKSIF